MPQVTSVQVHGHSAALLSPASLLGFPEGLAGLYWDAVNFQRYQLSLRFMGGGKKDRLAISYQDSGDN